MPVSIHCNSDGKEKHIHKQCKRSWAGLGCNFASCTPIIPCWIWCCCYICTNPLQHYLLDSKSTVTFIFIEFLCQHTDLWYIYMRNCDINVRVLTFNDRVLHSYSMGMKLINLHQFQKQLIQTLCSLQCKTQTVGSANCLVITVA